MSAKNMLDDQAVEKSLRKLQHGGFGNLGDLCLVAVSGPDRVRDGADLFRRHPDSVLQVPPVGLLVQVCAELHREVFRVQVLVFQVLPGVAAGPDSRRGVVLDGVDPRAFRSLGPKERPAPAQRLHHDLHRRPPRDLSLYGLRNSHLHYSPR